MSMRIDGAAPPPPPEEIGKAGGLDQAAKTTQAGGGPALTIDAAKAGDPQGGAGPLNLQELLPPPPPSPPPTTTQATDLSTKTSTDTVNSNAAMIAALAAEQKMIQSQQTAAKAEDTERRANVEAYKSKMDTAVSDLKQAGSDAWNAALSEGICGIVGSAFSMVGAGVGAAGGENPSVMTKLMAGSGDSPGMIGLAGNMIASGGKIGGGGWQKASTDKEGDEKSAEGEAGIFQGAEQQAAQYRDTFWQTQTSVIQSMQQIIQGEGASLESAASGRA